MYCRNWAYELIEEEEEEEEEEEKEEEEEEQEEEEEEQQEEQEEVCFVQELEWSRSFTDKSCIFHSWPR